MRYEGWDVMIFPLGLEAASNQGPVQEFRVQCEVVPDVEFTHTHGSLGIPTVSSFIASLSPGSPFRVSIHSWTTPEISRYARAYSRHPELVKIEARVLIDGRLVASCAFNRDRNWPQDIAHTFEVSKNGDLELLRFPSFRREMLSQQRWNAGDDIGRIKVILSEGFPRDSATMPIQRVKNLVAFSFQHAPLDVLENVEIAWPNQAMWNRSHLAASMVPTFHSKDGPSSHAHSPRNRNELFSTILNAPTNFAANMGSTDATSAINANFLHSLTDPAAARNMASYSHAGSDIFADATLYSAWMCHNSATIAAQGHDQDWFSQRWKPETNLDTAMAGMPPSSTAPQGPHVVQSYADNASRGSAAMSRPRRVPPKVTESVIDNSSPNHARAPTNTPINGHGTIKEHFSTMPSNSILPADLAVTLTNSLLNQPMPLSIQSSHNVQATRPSTIIRPHQENMSNGAYVYRRPSSAATHAASPMRVSENNDGIRMPAGAALMAAGIAAGTISSTYGMPRDIRGINDLTTESSPTTFSSSASQDEMSLTSKPTASTPSSRRNATPLPAGQTTKGVHMFKPHS